MSNERPGKQQPQEQSKCPHPEAAGKRWGDPISEERRQELQGYLDRWEQEQDHGGRKGPFDNGPDLPELLVAHKEIRLTGADVYWLAVQSVIKRDTGAVPAWRLLPNVELRYAYLGGAHLEGAYLPGADLESSNFSYAHLEGATLEFARLQHASLSSAHLEGASLEGAHLEGAYLFDVHLEGTDLRSARFDEDTALRDARFGPGIVQDWLDRLRLRNRNTKLGDIKWRDADMTIVAWERLRRLGDEQYAGLFAGAEEHRAAARACRQMAARLREQGMAEAADRFAYRAQVRQRGLLLRTFRLPQYLFSWVLAVLAGYGYRPGRTLLWYAVLIVGFAAAYFAYGTGCHIGSPRDIVTIVTQNLQHAQVCTARPLPWSEAFVVSFTAFHGRGFFATTFQPGDPQAGLAAAEAVLGLLIEISFIATFTQRFFGSR